MAGARFGRTLVWTRTPRDGVSAAGAFRAISPARGFDSHDTKCRAVGGPDVVVFDDPRHLVARIVSVEAADQIQGVPSIASETPPLVTTPASTTRAARGVARRRERSQGGQRRGGFGAHRAGSETVCSPGLRRR